MADPTPLPGLDEKIRRVNERLKMSGGDGHGPTGNDVENRVGVLEKSVEEINSKLDRVIDRLQGIETRLVQIEEKLEHKASSVDVAGIKGRVEALPTTWQMITLVFGILGGAFLILKYGLPHGP